jgi:hypothetical protein
LARASLARQDKTAECQWRRLTAKWGHSPKSGGNGGSSIKCARCDDRCRSPSPRSAAVSAQCAAGSRRCESRRQWEQRSASRGCSSALAVAGNRVHAIDGLLLHRLRLVERRRAAAAAGGAGKNSELRQPTRSQGPASRGTCADARWGRWCAKAAQAGAAEEAPESG